MHAPFGRDWAFPDTVAAMLGPTGFRDHPLDGALLRFHRTTGINVLRRGPSTAHLRRRAPRTMQVGLLTPCNLRCAFCYRDTRAPSRLTPSFLVDLLQRCATWGVLEV